MPSKVYATLEVDNFVNILLTGIVSSYVCACSVMPDSATPRTVARRAPQVMGFSRQESWSRLPFPTLAIFPTRGIKPTSLASPALAS